MTTPQRPKPLDVTLTDSRILDFEDYAIAQASHHTLTSSELFAMTRMAIGYNRLNAYLDELESKS
jgi:hypothetical protein